MLEVVVSFSTKSTAAPISTAKTTAKAKHHCAKDAPQTPSCPCVKVSSDGGSIIMEHEPAAKGGDGDRDGATAGAVRGRFMLNLPQKVVPGTAMSFFWQGDLIVRATLVGVE